MEVNDPLNLNETPPDQLFSPRVFFCKAGKFMEKLNKDMGVEEGDIVKERFGTEDFEESCRLEDMEEGSGNDEDGLDGDDMDGDGEGDDDGEPAAPIKDGAPATELRPGEVEIINARNPLHELPVLVFEGT